MKRVRIAAALAAFGLFSFTSAPAQANTYIIDDTASGYISSGGNFTGIRPNTNYLVGLCDANDCRNSPGEYRDYFYFAIPTLQGSAVSATLLIPTQSTTLDQSPTLTFQVTSLGIAESALGTGSFSNLGTGAYYGSNVYSAADADQTVAISLDAAALSDLGNGGTTFGLSGRVTSPVDFSTSAPDQLVFGYSQGSVTELVITTVPEPSTWAMLLVGFAALGFVGYRRARERVAQA